MGEIFTCPVCGNSDPRYVGYKNGKPYCRKCISFQGREADCPLPRPKETLLSLSYSLSKEQRQLSDQIVANFKNGIDTLVYAVCGSGKTEISYGVIGYAMSRGMKVGFALPRRDVVIELYWRLKSAFPKNKITAVYGGHTGNLNGDCLILTTHQLYRYPQFFDLIVMDEIDAFPFKGSEVLEAMFHRALKGHCLLMSATPSKEIVSLFKTPGHQLLTLHTRFHKHPIPVPTIEMHHGLAKVSFLIKKLREYEKEKKPCFVFVPSIDLSESLYLAVKPFCPNGNYVSSKREGRESIIASFKEGRYRYLVTTAVLERGITVSNLQVIIYGADHAIYDAASLIQIAGRVGRKAAAPDGEVLFLCDKVTPAMEQAIQEIKRCNTFL